MDHVMVVLNSIYLKSQLDIPIIKKLVGRAESIHLQRKWC